MYTSVFSYTVYTWYIYSYTPICNFFHVYSPVHEICAPAAGRECEVWEHKNNPQVVSGTIVPMDPHMHGVHPPSSYVSPFPNGRPQAKGTQVWPTTQ